MRELAICFKAMLIRKNVSCKYGIALLKMYLDKFAKLNFQRGSEIESA